MSYRQNVLFIVKKTPSEKEGEENFCYGDEGSPLWKFHNSVNGFDKEVQLAVLTGILTRYSSKYRRNRIKILMMITLLYYIYPGGRNKIVTTATGAH